MARPDWGSIQKQFLADHAKTSISPSQWCESKGINYATARRYIKKPENIELRSTAQESAQKKVRTAQVAKSAEDLIEDDNLTPLQAAFVLEYVKDKNATAAAGRAGYSDSNIGPQLMRNHKVKEAINRQLQAMAERHLITADRVIAEMAALGFSNFQDLTESSGEVANIHDLPRQTAAAIKEVKVKTSTMGDIEVEERTYKLHDKRAALNDLMKHLGLQEAITTRRLQELEIERRELELQRLRNEIAKPEHPSGAEDDYQLQALTPDEPLPPNPVL